MSKMIPMQTVCQKLGGDEKPLDPSSIYKWIKLGWLPKPVKLGRASRWREDEVDAALEHLASLRSTEPKPKLRWSMRVIDPKRKPEAAG